MVLRSKILLTTTHGRFGWCELLCHFTQGRYQISDSTFQQLMSIYRGNQAGGLTGFIELLTDIA